MPAAASQASREEQAQPQRGSSSRRARSSSWYGRVLDWLSGAPPPLQPAKDNRALSDINAVLDGTLGAAMQAALTSTTLPEQRQRAAWEQCTGLLQRLDAALSELQGRSSGDSGVDANTIRNLRASVFELYRQAWEYSELTSIATPEVRLQLLSTCAELVAAIAPGSEPHVVMASRYADRLNALSGSDSVAAKRALLAAGAAHTARYGAAVPGPLLKRLMSARRALLVNSSLASRLQLMTWQSDLAEQADRARAGLPTGRAGMRQ